MVPSHSEQKILPYTAAQMYALVMDVERYPEFLPWCLSCRILARPDADASGVGHLLAEMIVGYKIFREKFCSRVRFVPDSEIYVEYLDGPLKHLKNDWRFTPAPGGQGCAIDFHIDFEFHSRLLQSLIERFFHEALARMMTAFEKRAAALYG